MLGNHPISSPPPILLGSAQLAFVLGSRAMWGGEANPGGRTMQRVMIPAALGIQLVGAKGWAVPPPAPHPATVCTSAGLGYLEVLFTF